MMELLEGGTPGLGIILSPLQLARFEMYYRELTSWNERVNLTAITGYEDVQVKHFLDSLTVSLALPKPIPPGLNLLDVGAGGGFPGIPLAITYPTLRVTLLEATAKKAAFLESTISKLGLKDALVINQRAEESAHEDGLRERYDVVVARALAELSVLAELTLPFCRLGGRVIAQKKGDITAEMAEALRAISILGGMSPEVIPVHLAEFPDARSLVVIEKVAHTPAAYPRRPGVPAKKPLA
jgi:16S rRNA (guanine527-N7)-methyltransferase